MIKVAPISFSKASIHSQDLCNQIHELYLDGWSTAEIANYLSISKTAVRQYFYGVHNCPDAHFHWRNAFEANSQVGYIQHSLNQVRVGTSVPLYIKNR